MKLNQLLKADISGLGAAELEGLHQRCHEWAELGVDMGRVAKAHSKVVYYLVTEHGQKDGSPIADTETERGENCGIYLAPPHGRLIWNRRKSAIAKAQRFDLEGDWIVVSEHLAFGRAKIGEPEEVGPTEFDARFDEHRCTEKERQKWWPKAESLFLYPIVEFKGWRKPRPVQIEPGVQTFIERVDFKEIPEFPADVPVAVATKEAKRMPYSVDSPPDKVRGVPAKAQRIWVYAFNSCIEKRPKQEGECNQRAWGAVKNAGYYQDEQGNWHLRSQKERGEGQGVDGPKQGDGGAAYCVCPKCGQKVEHDRGTPCAETKCPKCGTAMAGSDDEKKGDGVIGGSARKEAWTTAYVNNLPDSAFLYVEPGGKKDDEGKTVPRSKRHLPYKNAEGQVDMAHLNNAASRLGQSATGEGWLSEDLRQHLQAKVQRLQNARKKEILDGLKAAFDGGMQQLTALYEAENLPSFSEVYGKLGFKTFTARDGRPWILTWTTNSFRDREGEIFRQKALEDYVGRMASRDVKGEFWFWHIPGTRFGTIQWQGMVGRFLVEAGPFDDTPVGRKFQRFFAQHPRFHKDLAPEGWGTSHGYLYLPGDRADREYEWLDKFETTVLPMSKASNPWNPQLEVLEMNDTQRKALETVGGADLVQWVQDLGDNRTKELEEKGVAYKAVSSVAGAIRELATEIVDEGLKEQAESVAQNIEGALAESDTKEALDGVVGTLTDLAGAVGGDIGEKLLALTGELTEPEPDAEPDPEAETKDAPEPEPVADPEPDPEAEAKEAPEPEPAAEPELEPEPEAKEAPEPESKEAPEPEPVPEQAPGDVDVTALATKIVEGLQLNALSDMIKEQQQVIAVLAKEVKELKERQAKVEDLGVKQGAIAALTPQAAWFRGTRETKTLTEPADDLGGPEESQPPGAIQRLARTTPH